MSQTIDETEAAVCADLKPEAVARSDFDALPEWMQTWLVRNAAAWKARCE